jgi:hypothetical protein
MIAHATPKRPAGVTIDGQVFTSRAALKRHTRSMIEAVPDGDMMPPAGADFILAMIEELHPWADDKLRPTPGAIVTGVRIRHASAVGIVAYADRNHAFVVFADGTEINFSWCGCIDGFGAAQMASKAMRYAIDDQRLAFKRSRFAAPAVVCDATGQPITWDDAHVDHHPIPFSTLRDRFLQAEAVRLDAVQLRDRSQGGQCMADAALAARWADYHRAYASFRLVAASVNMSAGNRHAAHAAAT